MKLWHDQPAIDIIWFRVSDQAETYRGWNLFASGIWNTEKANAPIGEQMLERRPWYNSANVWGYIGRGECGHDSVTARGGIVGVDPPIYTNPQGYSLCCKLPDLAATGGWLWGGTGFQGSPPISVGGGWVWGGTADFSVPLVAEGGWVWGGTAIQGSESTGSDIALSLCPLNPVSQTLYGRTINLSGAAACGADSFQLVFDLVEQAWVALAVDCGSIGLRDVLLRQQFGTLVLHIRSDSFNVVRSLYQVDCSRSFFTFLCQRGDLCDLPITLLMVDPTGSGIP